MRKIILLFTVVFIFISCEETKKEEKPLSATEMMGKIVEKEKAMPAEEGTAMMKKANPGKGGTAKITSGFINGGLSPIVGEASVSHGDVYDTLRLKVTNWGTARTGQAAIWNHYAITHIDVNAAYPGKFTGTNADNYNNIPNSVPSEWIELWPHQGLSVSYFFGVSSDGGWNYGGKTITNN